MSIFRVASRFNEYHRADKCPRCGVIFQDFIKIDEHLFGCFACGTVFVPKRIREAELIGKRDQLEKQLAESQYNELACCRCGRICKSVAGRGAHERFCKGNGDSTRS